MEPVYPDAARLRGIVGRVFIEVQVDLQGNVEQTKILHNDEPIFEEPALAAIRQWKFTPAEANGQAVKVYKTIQIKFGFH